MKRRLLIITGIIFFLLLITEIVLRTYFGFCDAVLIKADPDYEYIAQPGQNRFRFRNHIYYNKESMRSEEIDTTAIRVLFFGDSVLNGGALTDQDSLATSILTDTLSKYFNTKIQFLNISAGSWGPDNCFAYLKKHGDFGAKELFLLVSSHDAYDNMNFEKIVGVNEAFPDKQYKIALFELVDRYLLPRLNLKAQSSTQNTDQLGINKKDEHSIFNTGFESFLSYSHSHNLPLTIYLHADLKELKKGAYNEQGQEIINFSRENKIPLLKDLESGLTGTDFRDDIHLNNQGQRKMASIVMDYILKNSLL